MSRLGGFDGCLDRGAQYARVCYAQPLTALLSLLKSALVGGAVLGLVQPAFAVGTMPDQSIFPTSGQGIYAALLDLDGANPKSAPVERDDDAFAALASFAKGVPAPAKTSDEKAAVSRRAGDAVFSELANSPSASAPTRRSRMHRA